MKMMIKKRKSKPLKKSKNLFSKVKENSQKFTKKISKKNSLTKEDFLFKI